MAKSKSASSKSKIKLEPIVKNCLIGMNAAVLKIIL